MRVGAWSAVTRDRCRHPAFQQSASSSDATASVDGSGRIRRRLPNRLPPPRRPTDPASTLHFAPRIDLAGTEPAEIDACRPSDGRNGPRPPANIPFARLLRPSEPHFPPRLDLRRRSSSWVFREESAGKGLNVADGGVMWRVLGPGAQRWRLGDGCWADVGPSRQKYRPKGGLTAVGSEHRNDRGGAEEVSGCSRASWAPSRRGWTTRAG
jgi:hypothetical protein